MLSADGGWESLPSPEEDPHPKCMSDGAHPLADPLPGDCIDAQGPGLERHGVAIEVSDTLALLDGHPARVAGMADASQMKGGDEQFCASGGE